MKALRYIAVSVTTLVLFTVLLPSSSQASNTELELKILPLDCIFEIINDGNNTIHYSTPEECGVYVPPPDGPPSSPPGQPPITPPDGPPSSPPGQPPITPPGELRRPDSPPGQGRPDSPRFFYTPRTHPDERRFLQTDHCPEGLAGYTSQSQVPFELTLGDVLCFEVNNDARGLLSVHSFTVTEIGADYAVFVIASEPITDRLYVGQSGRYDTENNGYDNLEVTLQGVTATSANFTFRQLAQQTTPEPTIEGVIDSDEERSTTAWLPVIVLLLASVGIILLTWLYLRQPSR
jgi:hypothetical protein